MAQSKNELLIEHRVSPVKVVESDGSGSIRFEAVVSEVDYVNGNGRMYPRDVMWPAFEAMMQKITRHPGLVDHPGYFEPSSVSDVGVAWETFWLEGNLIVGRGRVVSTQKGKDLAAAIEAGVEIGFSTRGYGKSRDVQMDGRTVERMETYSFDPDGSIDAVINPSVRHARVRGYTKEELEKMDEELKQAKEALDAAETAKAEAEQKLAEVEDKLAAAEESRQAAEARVAELEGAKTTLEARVAELEAELARRDEEHAASQLEAKLLTLTGEHRFGAAIRAEVKKLAESGVAVTLENIETFVATFTALVESAAGAANEVGGAPRGDIRTDEDEDEGETLTPEQREELEKAGLL